MRLVEAPHQLYRIGRSTSPLYFSQISADDAAQPRGGNRFDVPGGGVMYFASQPEGCYAETLARFRPSPAVRAAVKNEDPSFMVCGGVPADWRMQRLLVTAKTPTALPFLDVEAPETHEHLMTVMADRLVDLNETTLDVAALRGPNRLLTRAVASWAYSAVDEDGEYRFSGLRYISRLGDHECWAVFSDTTVVETARTPVLAQDRSLRQVANAFHLRVF